MRGEKERGDARGIGRKLKKGKKQAGVVLPFFDGRGE